jgi:hypothetical protein
MIRARFMALAQILQPKNGSSKINANTKNDRFKNKQNLATR